ncbi:alpha/beta hydrolase [Nocardioides anomalus]|uniref:Alpha/beta hydrolase n=1 Tax=Nocardioides anomalus TaxID=2712223 RepID=A0A6G6WAD1_9ACTN|nr:alpha/beta hydrolase [Nocardioides anomalus]QIG42176.1 alpha/beta hydrolase [Nocardioides anomalus]
MSTTAPGPTVLDALSLLAEVGDELVVRTVRDTHLAVLGRTPAGPLHRGITTTVYRGLTGSLSGASRALDRLAATGVGPRLEADPRGRFVNAAVNGLIGDRLLRERPQMAIAMAVRRDGADVELETEALRKAFPQATGRLVLFLHGLCENESYWDRGRATAPTYADALAERGWTPVMLRANTGLGLRENGAALASLGQRLVDAWPVEVERVALVGHSLGGLVIRAAGAVMSDVERPWAERVSDVVTLGTPHLGAPIAWGVGHGSRALQALEETAAFGRILDWRSRGVHDLVAGLAEDVPPLPHARYHLVAATLTRDRRHPVGDLVGDLLVRPRSAYGRDRRRTLFPGADVLHVGRTDHFGLLNHPDVHRALRDWLA